MRGLTGSLCEMGMRKTEEFVRPDFLLRVAGVYSPPSGLTHRWVLGSKSVEATWSAGANSADTRDVTLVLCGQVHQAGFGSDAQPVLNLYIDAGLSAVTALEGSFLVVVIDRRTEKVLVFTDRFNSRKAYSGDIDSARWVATSLRLLPTESLQLDPTGIGSYLSSDGTHDGLTPYVGVEMLRQASVYVVEPGSIASDLYWECPYEPQTGVVSTLDLANEMAGLMRTAVKNKVVALNPSRVFLSLSGGVDSRGLLGLLVEALGPEKVTAISYYNCEQVGDMDLPYAQKAAAVAGVEHRTINGFDGDLISLLRLNAELGEGVAHFCDDAQIWRSLRPEFFENAGAVLVAGDRQWHWNPAARPSAFAALQYCSVMPPEVLNGLYPLLPAAAAAAMRDGWRARYEGIAAGLVQAKSWQHTMMRAYHEQRVQDTLMLWRERFCGESTQVSLPFLDRGVLEFVGRLPIELNNLEFGLLHKRAIKAAFPPLFSDGVADGGWNMPNWGDHIPRHGAALAGLVLDGASRLDDLIPPDVVLGLLADVISSGSGLESTEGAMWFLKKQIRRAPIVRDAFRRAKLRKRLERPRPVRKSRMLRSLLTLRLALGPPSASDDLSAN